MDARKEKSKLTTIRKHEALNKLKGAPNLAIPGQSGLTSRLTKFDLDL